MALSKRCEYCKHYEEDVNTWCRDCKIGNFSTNKYDSSYFEYNDELKRLLDETQIIEKNKELKRLRSQLDKIRKLVY
jgi:hypothetical protein